MTLFTEEKRTSLCPRTCFTIVLAAALVCLGLTGLGYQQSMAAPRGLEKQWELMLRQLDYAEAQIRREYQEVKKNRQDTNGKQSGNVSTEEPNNRREA